MIAATIVLAIAAFVLAVAYAVTGRTPFAAACLILVSLLELLRVLPLRIFVLVLAAAALAACDETDAASAVTNFGPEIIGTAFAAVAAYVARFAVNHVWLRGMLDRLLVEAKAAVAEVEQTYVDKITEGREDGTLTPEEAQAARSAAIAALKGNLGRKGLQRLGRILGLTDAEIDRLLGTRVEAAVKAMTQAKPLELVAGQTVATLQPAPAGASTR